MNIEPIHTPCKECVFAKYDNNTQIGCSLKYLDIYKAQSVDILEAYDNDLEFYIINGKKCMGYRENTWFVKAGLENATLEEKIAYYNSLNKLNYLLVINFKEIGVSEESKNNLLNSLIDLPIKPAKIVFIRDQELSHNTTYASINDLMNRAKINCPWRIQSMVDDNISNANILHSVICLNKQYRFICHIRSVPTSLHHIINIGNEIVHTKLDKFNVLSLPDHSCVLFPGGVYRYAIAEQQKDILAAIDEYQIV